MNIFNRLFYISGLFALFFFLFLFSSCRQEIVPEVYQPRSDHEAYLQMLEKAGMFQTALGMDWKGKAESCLNQAISLDAPFEESVYFDPSQAEGIGFMFDAKGGQKIEVVVDMIEPDRFLLFIDLFRVEENTTNPFFHVATAEKTTRILGFEPLEDATYILRIQPELLRGGKCNIRAQKVAAFQFPVVGKGKEDIWSFFGDPRDGGRRKHHGVDIFARRHTPIIAPTDGYVRFVGERGLGGKQVWLRDHLRSMSLYFAHLEDILVEKNEMVQRGDTLGTVGNSGNARTTRPHLHFGIYRNGPIDPFNFIVPVRKKIKPPKGDVSHLGAYVRTIRSTKLKISPASSNAQTKDIDKDLVLQAKGLAENYFRVKLNDGVQGYIPIRSVELYAPPPDPKL